MEERKLFDKLVCEVEGERYDCVALWEHGVAVELVFGVGMTVERGVERGILGTGIATESACGECVDDATEMSDGGEQRYSYAASVEPEAEVGLGVGVGTMVARAAEREVERGTFAIGIEMGSASGECVDAIDQVVNVRH